MTTIRRITFLAIALAWEFVAAAEPMHVYLTFSGAPETSIDINVMLKDKVNTPVDVYYDTEPRNGDVKAYKNHVAATYVFTTMEISDRRTMHYAVLKDLKPDTVYYFVAGEAKFGMSNERKFKTLPGGNKPFRFVDGGDMGTDGLITPLRTCAGK